MEDGWRGKLSRESPYRGRHGSGGAMCQARIVWADLVIRRKAGKSVYQVKDSTRRTSEK